MFSRVEIKFFQGITSKADLKKAYVKLMKENHPDNGGDPEICKQINVEYEYLFGTLPKEAAKDEKKLDPEKEIKLDKEVRSLIDKVIHMTGTDIEIVGWWVWIDGDSYQWRDELKGYGFRWSKSRKKWHWTPYKTGYRKNQKKKDFDELRGLFGSMKIEKDELPRLETKTA